jgi:short-subunit dehydrogenase
MCKKAIVTGASAGIGHALTARLVKAGYRVGVIARREEPLRELQKQFPEQIEIAIADVSDPSALREAIAKLVAQLGGLDLCVANAGIGRSNLDLQLDPDRETIEVNVLGFVATVLAAAQYFVKQGRGHIVGISSVAALRSNASAPAYNASKAFELSYLEALAVSLSRFGVDVTDIRPGFVYTEMTEKNEKMFWVATADVAAEHVYRAIIKKKRVAYITPRWRLAGWLMRVIPFSWWRRIQLKQMNQ